MLQAKDDPGVLPAFSAVEPIKKNSIKIDVCGIIIKKKNRKKYASEIIYMYVM